MTDTTSIMPRKKTVLLVSLFHPELVRGGAQQLCYELFQSLKSSEDYNPILLCAVDQKDKSLFKAGARITGFDARENEFLFLARDYDYWWHKSGSPILLESFVDFLNQTKPDIVHFHHFLLFGIDLLSLTRATLPDAKIIFTFHEFLAMCTANGQMVRTTDKSLCDRPSQVRCHQCFPDRPPEDFLVRKLWFLRHLGVVDIFTTPTKFMIPRYIEWGIPESKIFQVTNGQEDYAADFDRKRHSPKFNRFGFFGQLVSNKGVQIILRAVQILRQSGFTDFAVEINGGNIEYASPEVRKEIEDFIVAERELPFEDRIVEFRGEYEPSQLRYRMNSVDWCIVPSIWWEVFGLVISEAFMFGRPVIGSNIGGIGERIQHDRSGLLFNVGDAVDLAETMRRACTEDGLWEKLHDTLPTPPSRQMMTDQYSVHYEGTQTESAKPFVNAY
jgi:glycosyltransferase involved in cell wall biosynthesis